MTKRAPRERLYTIWNRMRGFCYNPNNEKYHRYGGRGITVEFDNYTHFKVWSLANGHDDRLSVDRINNDGPYSPDNCRWVDNFVQAQNKSTTVLNPERVRLIRKRREEGTSYSAIARELGISRSAVAHVAKGRAWRNVG